MVEWKQIVAAVLSGMPDVQNGEHNHRLLRLTQWSPHIPTAEIPVTAGRKPDVPQEHGFNTGWTIQTLYMAIIQHL